MYSGEIIPAFRGADYIDDATMVDADTGTELPWDPTDQLVWRLRPLARRGAYLPGYGFGAGWDYGFAAKAVAAPGPFALLTLTIGAGLVLFPTGGVQWRLPSSATWLLRDPEYRMTLDLVRYGETVRLLDTTLPIEA